MPRVMLLTGDQLRHRYAAQRLAGSVELVGIVAESKVPPDSSTGELSDHFSRREDVERRLLLDIRRFPQVPLRLIENGSVNSPETSKWITEANPDVVVLYGTGLIRQPLIDHFPGRMVNLHLGLSPWYRGSATNFWPFVYRQPECVGATLHMVVAKVDAGPILTQVRPDWNAGDGIHEAGTRTLIAGVEELGQIVSRVAEGSISGSVQDLSVGRVFRQRDFNVESLQVARQHLSEGMVEEYLCARERRDALFPLVRAQVSPALAAV